MTIFPKWMNGGRTMSNNQNGQSPAYMPTLEDIARETAKIRAKWSKKLRESRRQEAGAVPVEYKEHSFIYGPGSPSTRLVT